MDVVATLPLGILDPIWEGLHSSHSRPLIRCPANAADNAASSGVLATQLRDPHRGLDCWLWPSQRMKDAAEDHRHLSALFSCLVPSSPLLSRTFSPLSPSALLCHPLPPSPLPSSPLPCSPIISSANLTYPLLTSVCLYFFVYPPCK